MSVAPRYTREKPRARPPLVPLEAGECDLCSLDLMLDLELADGVVNRTEHREHHPSQDQTEHDRERGLDHDLDPADALADFAIVEVAHVEQRGIERSGTL